MSNIPMWVLLTESKFGSTHRENVNIFSFVASVPLHSEGIEGFEAVFTELGEEDSFKRVINLPLVVVCPGAVEFPEGF